MDYVYLIEIEFSVLSSLLPSILSLFFSLSSYVFYS
jgi:hypothetical protein